MVTLAPVRTAVFKVTVCPNEWNSGNPPKITSSGVSLSRVEPVTSALRVRLAWVNSAPLGLPVVPEVYRITAVSVASRSWTASTAGWPARPARNVGPTSTTRAPASAAPALACSANGWAAKSIPACASAR